MDDAAMETRLHPTLVDELEQLVRKHGLNVGHCSLELDARFQDGRCTKGFVIVRRGPLTRAQLVEISRDGSLELGPSD